MKLLNRTEVLKPLKDFKYLMFTVTIINMRLYV